MTESMRNRLIIGLNLSAEQAAQLSTEDMVRRVLTEWSKSTDYWHGQNAALLAQVERLRTNPTGPDLAGAPAYRFANAEEALAKVAELGDELAAVRRREMDCLTHLRAAVQAADQFPGMTRQEIIDATKVSRRTAYAMFD
jgi:hypothetical protein